MALMARVESTNEAKNTQHVRENDATGISHTLTGNKWLIVYVTDCMGFLFLREQSRVFKEAKTMEIVLNVVHNSNEGLLLQSKQDRKTNRKPIVASMISANCKYTIRYLSRGQKNYHNHHVKTISVLRAVNDRFWVKEECRPT